MKALSLRTPALNHCALYMEWLVSYHKTVGLNPNKERKVLC